MPNNNDNMQEAGERPINHDKTPGGPKGVDIPAGTDTVSADKSVPAAGANPSQEKDAAANPA